MESTELFKAFSDPTRLRVAHLVANCGPDLCVCDICEVLELPQSTVSRQLALLRRIGVLRDRRDGVWMYYSMAEPDTALRTRLAECLRCCLQDEPELKADLVRFRKLRKGKQLCGIS